jgi:hypothetical protein
MGIRKRRIEEKLLGLVQGCRGPASYVWLADCSNRTCDAGKSRRLGMRRAHGHSSPPDRRASRMEQGRAGGSDSYRRTRHQGKTSLGRSEMDDERDSSHPERGYSEVGYTAAGEPTSSGPHTSGWLIAAVVVLIVALCVAVGHSYVQQKASSRNASQEAHVSAMIGQLQSQVDALNAKLNALAAAPAATVAAKAAATEHPARPAPNREARRRRMAADNRRYKQLQSELADQQNQLKDTQNQLAQDRSDLEGNINSTRDELNGSIAKTHDELVALEQKGERNYFEFDLAKSKRFQHAGPVMVSLRKANAKHKDYDLAMIVDDNQLNKKHVNLYEPIWIDSGDSQELQLVVNKVDKDHVHGYVSAPKYSQSASFTPSSNGNAVSSASTSTGSSPASDSNNNSSSTTQQPTQ